MGVKTMWATGYQGNKNVISVRLKARRKWCKVTQQELAARMQVLGVNIDQRSISKIEHNDRAVTDFELACFCKALQCMERDLLQDFYESLENDR